jgi:WXG100 family type VII secretion target
MGFENGFSMNFNGMDGCIQDLKAKTVQIRNLVTQLEEDSRKTLVDWDGDAKAQYEAERKIWNDAINRMEAGLNTHTGALTNIHGNTRRTENRNTMSWQGQGRP